MSKRSSFWAVRTDGQDRVTALQLNGFCAIGPQARPSSKNDRTIGDTMPINSRADYKRYLAADLTAHGLKKFTLYHRFSRPTLCYQRRLRYVEYLTNCRRGKLWKPYVLFSRWRLQRLGILMGFDIAPNVFGPGLNIVHWGTIMVSPLARVGANCRILPSTSIAGEATLGDDVYVGPGAKVFGKLRVGDRVRIGANAVVIKSYPSDVTIAEEPSRAYPRRAPGAA
jgi:serine O-acetyltransferase